MAKKLVSIIVPVYNKEDKLRRCLDSLINQSRVQLEIILVNDGSTDKSGEICDEYKMRDNRIKVLHKRNGGVSSARNIGLDMATGDYIGFVDADDYLEMNMYSKLLDFVNENCSTVVQCDHFYGEGDIQSTESNENVEFDKSEFFESLLTGKNSVAYLWNKLYPAELTEGIYFDDNISFGEDLLWNYRVLQNADDLIFISDKLYHYEIDEQSICGKYSEKMQQLIDVYDLIIREQKGDKYYKALCGRTRACLIILSHMARSCNSRHSQMKDMIDRLWKGFNPKLLHGKIMTITEKIKLISLKISPIIYKILIKGVHRNR